MTRTADTVRHGYTMDDLHTAAYAATITKTFLAADRQDLYQAAWDAIVDLLCTAQDPPTPYDLKHAGQRGIQRLRDDFIHTHGYNRDTGVAEAAPNFAKYWGHSQLWDSPVEDAVVEKVALEQVFATLSASQRKALLARAAADTQEQAARLAMVGYAYLGLLVREGRRAFFALWYEHETVAVRPRVNYLRRSRERPPCGTRAGYVAHRSRKERACDRCRAAAAAYQAQTAAARARRVSVVVEAP